MQQNAELDNAVARSMVWNALWLVFSAKDQHFQMQVLLWRMRRILMTSNNTANWRLNLHELRKISVCLTVGDCLFCIWGPKCCTSRGNFHIFLGTFFLLRKQKSSRAPNKEISNEAMQMGNKTQWTFFSILLDAAALHNNKSKLKWIFFCYLQHTLANAAALCITKDLLFKFSMAI